MGGPQRSRSCATHSQSASEELRARRTPIQPTSKQWSFGLGLSGKHSLSMTPWQHRGPHPETGSLVILHFSEAEGAVPGSGQDEPLHPAQRDPVGVVGRPESIRRHGRTKARVVAWAGRGRRWALRFRPRRQRRPRGSIRPPLDGLRHRRRDLVPTLGLGGDRRDMSCQKNQGGNQCGYRPACRGSGAIDMNQVGDETHRPGRVGEESRGKSTKKPHLTTVIRSVVVKSSPRMRRK